jgi:hypothetical protein
MMRRTVSTSMILTASLFATQAFADSISTVTGLSASQPSILSIDCAHCPPPAEKAKADYQVPSIPPGSQTAEVVEIDGQKKLRRVESWLGGSPVVVYTSAEGWATNGSTIMAGTTSGAAGIDHGTTTAAVEPAPPTQEAPALAGFELRLN